MPRKLVTARRVADLQPIPKADRIQRATVDGWTCIVPVGDFSVGDLALYIEIDSFLPASDPRWDFLSASGKGSSVFDGARGVRVKTMKLKGVVSQGLLVPLRDFPEVKAAIDQVRVEAGKGEQDAGPEAAADARIRAMSFEELLGIRKWEKPAVALNDTADTMVPFPQFIPVTDQERIQNVPDVFDKWADAVFQESTKMDGSSMTVYFVRRDSPHFAQLPTFPPPSGGEAMSSGPATIAATVAEADQPSGRMGVCSRKRDIAPDPGRLFWAVALRHGLAAKLETMGRNVALQGELCGDRVQGNFEGFSPGQSDFFLFTVWDIDARRYIPPREVHEEWAPRLRLQHVPVVGYFKLSEIGQNVSDILERAEGKGLHGRKREGIVLKHVDSKFSFKAVSNSYLLKHGE